MTYNRSTHQKYTVSTLEHLGHELFRIDYVDDLSKYAQHSTLIRISSGTGYGSFQADATQNPSSNITRGPRGGRAFFLHLSATLRESVGGGMCLCI